MVQFEIEADVPESRQVTVTLPPETPMGRVRLAVTACDESQSRVTYVRPANPVEAAEYDEFIRLLPSLRSTHGGHFVAVRGGKVIASGLYLDSVLKLARAEAGTAAFYCEWVEPVGGYIFQSGKIVIEPAGEAR